MDDRFQVVVGAGTMMSDRAAAICFPHRWTPGGVTVEADFTGGHLLHLAAAGCVLNDVYRESAALGIELHGVRVTAAGGFDAATWRSTGIGYSVEVSSDAPPINSLACSKQWTGWLRFPVPSEPERPSSGSAEPGPGSAPRGNLTCAPHRFDDPVIIAGSGVTHLRYAVRQP